jgi:hypothetical protein
MSFLEGTNQLYTHQYGFRAKHCTAHPVIHLLNQVANENDKITKNITMATFLDLSKAFDTISHNILLKKLEKLGIRGIANTWFKSYLSGRRQYMEIYKVKSHLEENECGVPQGSILGPILFLLYINDIQNSTFLKVLCFADDTTCSYSSSNTKKLYDTMNQELEKINQWFRANKLCLNISKTKYIIFRPSGSHHALNDQFLYIDNKVIEQIGNHTNTTFFKFLGMAIDENISWKKQIDNVCAKISRANYIINKVKNTIPKHCLLTLYQSIIQCHINFGLQIWGSSSSVERIFKLQKRSIRIINRKAYNYHTEPLFKECKILKIKDQYKGNVAIFMQQLRNGKLPKSFNDLKYFTKRERPTRHTYMNMAKQYRARTTFSSLLTNLE